MAAPGKFAYQGQIIKPNGAPLEETNVQFTLQIFSPGSEECLLYEETHTINMQNSNGLFSLTVGEGSRVASADYEDTSTIDQILSNASLITATTCAVGSTYTPSVSDGRKMRVTFNDGIETVTIDQDHLINSVPYAANASTIDGFSVGDLITSNTSGSYVLTQTNVNALFDNANYTELMALIGGTSTQYLQGTPSADFSLNSNRITNLANPTAATDATNKQYVDSSIAGGAADTATLGSMGAGDAGEVLVWDGTQWTTQTPTGDATKLPLAGGTMTGPINMGTQNISNATDISLTNDLTVGNNVAVTGSVAATGGYSTTGTLAFYEGTGTNYVGFQAPAAPTDVIWTLPAADGSPGQVLSTNGSGTLQWGTLSFGDLLNGGNSGAVVVGSNDSTLALEAAGSTAMTILANGNVGIGTTNPLVNLQVSDPTPEIRIVDSDNNNRYLSLSQNDDISTISNSTGTVTAINIDPDGGTGSTHSVGLFRTTNTTSDAHFTIYAADGTASINHRLSNGDSYLAALGGNVGIGTTVPGGKLDVDGDIRVLGSTSGYTGFQAPATAPDLVYTLPGTAPSAGQILSSDASGVLSWIAAGAGAGDFLADGSVPMTGPLELLSATDPATPELTFNGDENTGIFQPAADSIGFATAGSQQMVIDSSGNIGIGTDTPAHMLEVAGDVTIRMGRSGLLTRPLDLLIPDMNSGDTVESRIGRSTNGLNTANFRFIYAGDNSTSNRLDIDLYGFATPGISLLGSGNVGIGTATPAATLDVTGTDAIVVPQGTTAERPVTGENGMIRYNSTNSKMEAYENGGWTEFATGSVGTGDFMADGSVPMSGALELLSSSDAATPELTFNGDENTGIFQPAADNIGFSTSGTQRMSIDSSGHVSIGTTTPENNLNVHIDDATVYSPTVSPLASVAAKFHNDSDTVGSGSFIRLSAEDAAGRNAVAYIGSIVSASPYMSSVVIGHRTSNSGYAERLRIDENGNIGVGTTTPAATLDVTGTDAIIVPQGTTAERPSTGENGMIRYNSDNSKMEAYENGAWTEFATGSVGAGDLLNGGNTGAVVVGSNDSTLSLESAGSTAITVDGSQNVGIGTTVPSYSLDVNGNFSARMDSSTLSAGHFKNYMNNANSYPALQIIRMREDSTQPVADFGTSLAIRAEGTTDGGTDKIGDFGAAWETSPTNAANRNSYLHFGNLTASSYSEKMRITSSGHIGVGTTSPGVLLDLRGENALPNTSGATQTGALRVSSNGTNMTLDMGVSVGEGSWIQSTQRNLLSTSHELLLNPNGGFVGVGTTAPAATFDVTGTDAIIVPQGTTAERPSTGENGMIRYNSTSSKMEAYENGAWTDMIGGGGGSGDLLADGTVPMTAAFELLSSTDAATPELTFNGDENTGIFQPAADEIGFSTAGSEVVRIDSSGNLGIGTNAPAQPLHVLGNGRFSNAANTSVVVSRDGGSAFQVQSRSSATYLGTTSSTPLIVQTSGSDRMTIDASGNIGIGTATASSLLHVQGALTVGSNAPGNVSQTAATFTAPSAAETNLEIYGSRGSGSLSSSTLDFYNNSTQIGQIQTMTGNSSTTGEMTFSTRSTSLNEVMRLTRAGRVGIGTTTPATTLDVAGTDAIIVPQGTTAERPSTGENGMIRYNSTTTKMEAYENGAWTDMIGGGGGGSGDLLADGTVPMTAPFELLSDSDAATPELTFNGDENTGIFQPAADSIAFSTAGTEQMVIDSSGNVGIGTTTPGATLDIYDGNAAIGSRAPFNIGVLFNIQKSRSGGIVQADDDIGLLSFLAHDGFTHMDAAYIKASVDGTPGLADTPGRLVFGTTADGSGIASERMRIDNAGNVGIGTTNPAARLHVDGSGAGGGVCVTSDGTCSAVPTGGEISAETTLNTGADYAEYFEAEETLSPGDLVGLNRETGRARGYQAGDLLLGIVSTDPGVIGNSKLGNQESVLLVALLGQVPFNKAQVTIEDGQIFTLDKSIVGYLLANGNAYINLNSSNQDRAQNQKIGEHVQALAKQARQISGLKQENSELKERQTELMERLQRLENLMKK